MEKAKFDKQILFQQYIKLMNLKSIQRKAKETLQFLSNHQVPFNWNTIQNQYQPRSLELKPRKNRDLLNFDNRNKTRISTAVFTGKNIKNLIVPKIISFQQCPISMREMNLKNIHKRDMRKRNSIYSNKTLINQSITIEQEIQGIDFMKFWVRHRFQQKSIDSLVSRIQQKRKQLRELRS